MDTDEHGCLKQMKATEAQIEERMPAWEALSDFFLDNILQPDDYERIAQTLAATTYTEKEIEDILIGEVCPVCESNMFSLAGEWLGFNQDWLKEKISPRIGKRPKFRSLFILRHPWMYAWQWKKVKTRMSEIRAR
jgi:hypothetical protein